MHRSMDGWTHEDKSAQILDSLPEQWLPNFHINCSSYITRKLLFRLFLWGVCEINKLTIFFFVGPSKHLERESLTVLCCAVE